jgi:hypothetical protein
MNYQDNKRVQTAEELRQMYDLDSLKKNRKAIENNTQGLTKIESEQNSILKSIIINLGETLENQSDISLWFFNGIPTLENVPVIEWDNKDEHIGDFYYDKDTGLVYEFIYYDEEYKWEQQNDTNLIQAMALTNAELDTIDGSRRVFFNTPTTPYDNGDWYIDSSGDLYICQISKQSNEIYDPTDFIIASKYTDDTKANEIAGKLTIVSGQVTTIINNLDVISQTIEDNRYYVDENGEKHLISETTSQLLQNVNSLKAIFQITGGNNLIKNSAGLFSNNYWDTEKTGTVEFGEDNDLIGKTSSSAKIKITNDIVKTSSDNITGLTIDIKKSFSYKIKQDEDTVCKISLYGLSKDSPLYEKTFTGEMDWTEIFDYESSFFVDSPNLTLEIQSISEYGNSTYISDLMLNDGEKQQWQPSTGEIWGTIIKMSQQGISCYSEEGGYITMMTSQGFQVRALYGTSIGDIITKLTNSGLETIDITQSGKYTQQNLVHDVITSDGNEVYIEYIKG